MGQLCSIQDCKRECHMKDNTPETPNLEDYKSPSDREQEREKLEIRRKKKLILIEYMNIFLYQ